MITCNVDEVVRQLQAYHEETVRSLKRMVTTFAYYVTLEASRNTPVGDFDGNASYQNLYKIREETYGIEATPGFHAGAWRYSEQWNDAFFDPTIYTEEQAAIGVKQDVASKVQLGKKFYIRAMGPAYSLLDKGYSYKAPDGIVAPTLDTIASVYSLNLANYYKGSQ